MATYKEIFGKQIKFLSSDPDNEAEGQIWYNSTSNTLKTVVNSGAWAATAPINTIRNTNAGIGTQTASLLMGGTTPPYPTKTDAVEEYNGTGWRTETSLPGNRQGGAGAGTTTAALFAGGMTPAGSPGSNTSFEFDGSTWTASPGTMNLGRTQVGSGGTQAAAVIYGGSEWGSPGGTPASETYDGSTWTTSGTMTTARYGMMGSHVGTQTASLAIGGGPYTTNVEEFNGSSWSLQSNIPTASDAQTRYGTTTAAVAAGGGPRPAIGTKVFQGDGTTWTATPDMGSSRSTVGGAGTTTAGVIGGAQPFIGDSEEYNVADTIVVPGAWASGGALNTGRTLGGSALPAQNAGIIFGGSSPYTGATEQYNGTAWTTVPGSLNTARGYISGFGTETAAVCAGGYHTPNPGIAEVEEYNGTSWSEETNLPSNLKNAGNCGTLTAGLLMGGSTSQPFAPNVVDTSLHYDGTNWTSGGTMPVGRGQGMSGGVQTAAFYAGGRTAPAYVATSITYNGTSFSTAGNLAFGAGPPSGFQGSIGTSTAGLAASGLPTNLVNTFDGTNWFSAPAYTSSRNRGFSGGTQTAALIAGGATPGPQSDLTEEFTGETTAANVQTITTS